ncbi:hypothetical protein KSP40_PGU004266 [Platanthera guangdongensis]|uniref:Uncharacterized protein n=1 Tax=Platanthera guangdongensis TaxID=2320717 RepID=A0ABR2MAA1_9ASPA
MEKRKAAGSNASLCQKLYNVFLPTIKPLGRHTFRKQKIQPPAAPPAVPLAEEGRLIMIQNLESPADQKQRRNYRLHERADNFIARTRLKIRSGSTIGRPAA